MDVTTPHRAHPIRSDITTTMVVRGARFVSFRWAPHGRLANEKSQWL